MNVGVYRQPISLSIPFFLFVGKKKKGNIPARLGRIRIADRKETELETNSAVADRNAQSTGPDVLHKNRINQNGNGHAKAPVRYNT